MEAFAAWRRFVEALAENGPTVLVFEDIHWADDALLEFIELIADRAGGVPLLIVCTARPELLERRARWAGGMTKLRRSCSRRSPTTTLRGSSADCSTKPYSPPTCNRALLAQAEGNPLYAQEYVRMLQDRGLLVQGGRWMDARRGDR